MMYTTSGYTAFLQHTTTRVALHKECDTKQETIMAKERSGNCVKGEAHELVTLIVYQQF